MHQRHTPTHAWPGLPVVPDPNPTPPNTGPSRYMILLLFSSSSRRKNGRVYKKAESRNSTLHLRTVEAVFGADNSRNSIVPRGTIKCHHNQCSLPELSMNIAHRRVHYLITRLLIVLCWSIVLGCTSTLAILD